MIRIYYPEITSTLPLILEGKKAHHIQHVLRCKIGDSLVLFDGKNREYQAIISKVDKKHLYLSILDEQLIQRESRLNIHLIQGISKGERMDWVVQKAVELGVSRITPVYTQHGAVSLNADRTLKKQLHWENIVISACEQSGRNVIPTCDVIQSFSESLLISPPENCARWILHPIKNAETNNSQSFFAGAASTNIPHSIQLLIGPEGGFSEQEVMQAQNAGFVSLQLGPRILRTETAAIAAIAALQALFGDLFS